MVGGDESVVADAARAVTDAGFRVAGTAEEPTTRGDESVLEGVECVVIAATDGESLAERTIAVRREPASLPIVAVLVVADEATVGVTDAADEAIASVLDAGADEIVRGRVGDDGFERILEHRIDRTIRAAGASGATETVDVVGERPVADRVEALEAELEDVGREQRICQRIVAAIVDTVACDACGVVEARDGEFVPLAATAAKPSPGRARLRTDEGVAGESYRAERIVYVRDVQTHDRARADLPYRSVLSVPVGDIGVLQVASTNVDAYDAADRETVARFADVAEHAMTRVRFERSLTQERDRAAALFQNIPDAAVEYVLDDGAPRIERVNSAFVRLFGYEPEESVGETTLDLLVPSDGVDEALDTFETLRDGEFTEREVERVTTNGSSPFLLRNVPISSESGLSTGYLIYTDISELVERERQLERQNERLDAFASMVSHDLRNPLSAAQGYVDLTQETSDLSHLEVVQAEHERMFDMIDDLLTLARQGEAIGDVETVDLEGVVASAWETVDTANATVETASLPAVEGDPDRIRQLFENLFRNAALHAGPDVNVTVGGFPGGFFVADDGPGIPEAERDAVLEMGMTTAKGEGGTGFGLAIVTEVADGHGWGVEVTESESGGARFEFHTECAPVAEGEP
ncbi:GAF domain-containing protein [Halorubellus sp. JP-L1]|uniref:ATP-binding protein n=1 Tax=Halorubellus sp. JP-L1 TaxID=2715753 RepID=UPI00140BEF9C|nr:GAF domain-containing protein [Halorubellus sp. JP-L1]